MDLANADVWQVHAHEVDAVEQDDEDLAYLWLAQRSNEGTRYLTLSRLISADKDVYIERDDQAWSCHGGIDKLRLRNDGMEVYLTPDAASSLGGVRLLKVSFGPKVAAQVSEIEKALRIVLAEKPAKLIADSVT